MRPKARSSAAGAVISLLLLIASVASHAAAATPTASTVAAKKARAALACAVSTSCVNSLDGSDLAPLQFAGTPAEALAALRAALAEFPDGKILTADDVSMEVVFTTDRGFRDLVDFKIDAQAQRIDFRSHSSFGRNDFGKNRSRMLAFSALFEKNNAR